MIITAASALAIFGAGLAAGTINTVVGSGTLITFPVLLAFGYPPVLANVSNNVGLVPGTVSGIHGYRQELAGQRDRVIRLGSASLLGGLTGAILLLVLPQSAFQFIVPVLIALALVMVVAQPWLARKVSARQRAAARRRQAQDLPPGPAGEDGAAAAPAARPPRQATALRPAAAAQARVDAPPVAAPQACGPVTWVLVFAMGIYGGYFGAAQGILLLGLLGITFTDGLQRINAVKNVLTCTVNAIAALVFISATHIDWAAAGLIAAGSVVGGQVGARLGRRLSPWALRAVIVAIGVVALIRLLA